VAVFNMEMIGKTSPHGPNSAWITGFDRSSFGEILQRTVAATGFSFFPDPIAGEGLFFGSDNAPFARLGVPAHSISTTPMSPPDPDYHRVTDEIETLDMSVVTTTIQAIARAATTIVSGAETPTRVAVEGQN
jgi:Zn-dependent M28 family amino/carboxypeptidase